VREPARRREDGRRAIPRFLVARDARRRLQHHQRLAVGQPTPEEVARERQREVVAAAVYTTAVNDSLHCLQRAMKSAGTSHCFAASTSRGTADPTRLRPGRVLNVTGRGAVSRTC
jgi:hypothetical protein